MKNLVTVALLIFIVASIQIQAKLSDVNCGACHMLVDQITWGISQTDPKRTIQVGSFRIMPDGSQRLNEIPFKQSDTHISELLDSACSNPNDYYQTTDELSGRKLYKRQQRRDGKPASMKNVQIGKDSMKMLKFACEGIAEDFDEEITKVFKKKEDNYLYSVCVQTAEVCLEDQLYDVNPEEAEEDGDESEMNGDVKSEADSEDEDSADSKEDEDSADSEDESETEGISNRSEL
ncbi:protein canopy homolog 2-like isoform X2 [Watersipora subatra]|uniref:protein canopy homolog 2-like isoform X2 n=1 Tax=Watersipora subatra TaxID=2589382 RepID=UPI00355AD379